MSEVKKGDTVTVDYLGSLTDGSVFDTSIEEEAVNAGLPPRDHYEPLQFTVGTGQVIAGFDNAVIGMKVGDEKTVEIPPEKAYGQKRQDLILTVPKSQLEGNDITAEEGMILNTPNGMQGVIVEVTETEAKVDFNSPLAGEVLVFKIILRKISA